MPMLKYLRIFATFLPLQGEISDWAKKSFLNAAVKIKTSLPPFALLTLLKNIEKEMERQNSQRWAPRIIDLDLLCYEQIVMNEKDLQLPHAGLHERVFAMQPLLEIIPDYTHPVYPKIDFTNFSWQSSAKKLPYLLEGPEIVGILNITPDSFSDGGKYLKPEEALFHAESLFSKGANIIDIGAESTRPNAALFRSKEEWQRLEPVIHLVKQRWQNQEHRPIISIDTRHAQTLKRAVHYDIDWLNDVSQAEFSQMIPILKEFNLKYIAMHNTSEVIGSHKPTSGSILHHLKNFKASWQECFTRNQLSLDQLILDPGIGFGKSVEQHLELFKHFHALQSGSTIPWLVGHSRKSFIRETFTQANDLDFPTAMLSGFLSTKHVNYLRVHAVAPSLTAIRLHQHLH